MDYFFRKADSADLPEIWMIMQEAIQRRKQEGSRQWQDGYPNEQVIESDILSGEGYVLVGGGAILGYVAILVNKEPAYENIEGQWLTNGDFVVFHRIAVGAKHAGKGIATTMLKYIEGFALSKGIGSVRADTNFDNTAMLKTFEKMGYVYCGEVMMRGSSRRAFEKKL